MSIEVKATFAAHADMVVSVDAWDVKPVTEVFFEMGALTVCVIHKLMSTGE
jgi:hypothetical protein